MHQICICFQGCFFSLTSFSSVRYIIGLTLGPTFLSSSLYLSISTLQRQHEAFKLKSISPRTFSILFILGDFMCLCFIGVGGSLAAIYASNPIGVDLMIAGLASQVVWTMIFCILLAVIYFKARHMTVGNMNYFILGEFLISCSLVYFSAECEPKLTKLTLYDSRYNSSSRLPFYSLMLAGR